MAQVEHMHSASAVKATAQKRLRKLPPPAQLLLQRPSAPPYASTPRRNLDNDCNFCSLKNLLTHSSCWGFEGYSLINTFKLKKKITHSMIQNSHLAWPCWNCTGSYKFSVSVKKMGEGWTGGASDIIKAESSGEDPSATGVLVSNLITLG